MSVRPQPAIGHMPFPGHWTCAEWLPPFDRVMDAAREYNRCSPEERHINLEWLAKDVLERNVLARAAA